MKKTICFAVLVLLLPHGFLAQPAVRSLVSVDNPLPGSAATLLASGITVVDDVGRYLLVLATAEDLATIHDLNLVPRVLDKDIEGKTYYLASAPSNSAQERIAISVRVLRCDGVDVLIDASPAQAEQLASGGIDIARVVFRPIRLPSSEKPTRTVAQNDPVIRALVDSVSTQRIDAVVLRLQNFVTRHSQTDSCLSAGRYIKSQFESFGIDSVYFHEFSTTLNDNVVAVMPGLSDTEGAVIIGGHYDSISDNQEDCPGADDNASGTAGVLECARVLSKERFENTIIFIAFCGEEQGLRGSAAWAGEAGARGDDIIAAINMDMIGYLAPGDVLDLDVIDNESSSWLRDLAMEVGGVYVPALPMVDGNLPGTALSDHRSFWNTGYDAIMLFEETGGLSPFMHSTDDVVGISYNSPQLAEQTVKVAGALAATLAQPFRVAIRHSPLENQTDPRYPYRVTAEILAAGSLDTDGILVHYNASGNTNQVPLVYTGSGDIYEALIPAQPGGTVVDYYITAEDSDGYRTTHPREAPADHHRFAIGSAVVIVEDDFETDTGWTVGDAGDDASAGIWTRVDPNGSTYRGDIIQPEDDHTPDPGVMCFVTGNGPRVGSADAADVDFGTTTLLSPIFDLSAYSNAWLRYHRWYNNVPPGRGEVDEWVVDASADSGQSWVRLETRRSSNRSWELVARYIDLPLSPNMRFRFVASDIDPPSIVEAAIDDFAIITYVDSMGAVVQNLPPSIVQLSQNAPNPFNPETRIRFEIGGSGERVTLRIYDVAGRVVTTLLDGEFVTGQREVPWDGRLRDGRNVATGVYFYRLEAGGQTVSRKLAVIR